MRASPGIVLFCLANVACQNGTNKAQPTGPVGGTGPGAKASVFAGASATKLIFEVDYVQGTTPNAGSLQRLKDRLQQLQTQAALAKPEGIDIQTGNEIPAHTGSDHAYTIEELSALADTHQQQHSGGGNAVAHVMYVDGHYAEDTASEKVLGVAYGGERIVMFADTIANACDGTLPLFRAKTCEIAEATVLVHEFGHILGLVNNGTAMQVAHQDTVHGAHDSNTDCVMYWTVNQASYVAVLGDAVGNGSDAVPAFDDACLADLKGAVTDPGNIDNGPRNYASVGAASRYPPHVDEDQRCPE